MDDNEILDLYFARSEQAIVQTDQKYGFYCYSIAKRILSDPLDAEESVNDTYYSAWKLIPPRRPQRFSTFLGKITRNLAIDRWRKNTAETGEGGRRRCCWTSWRSASPEAKARRRSCFARELTASLNRFLRKLPEKTASSFCSGTTMPVQKDDIARKTGLSSNQVKYILQKVRKQLADTLKRRVYNDGLSAFQGLTGVDGELLAAVEPVDSRKEPTTKKLPARKIWLIAAVIALALLLVGCAVAYALTVF